MIALLVGLSIAHVRGAFTPVVHGDADASTRSATSCSQRADVKVRGLIVGEVAAITTDGDGADARAGARTRTRSTLIPRNVTARLLPKTLFGERYVSLRAARRRRRRRRSPRAT